MLSPFFLSFRQKADDENKENPPKNTTADGGKLKKKKKKADGGKTTVFADSGKEKNTTRPSRVSLESAAPIPRKKNNKRKRQPGKPKDDENSPAPKE